jgi:hypothetical protein
MALQANCPAGGSAPFPAAPCPAVAALPALMRAAAAETLAMEWACALSDSISANFSGGRKAAMAVPDAYGGASAAALASGPLLTAAGAEELQSVAAGDAAFSSTGTTVISGGLGGLGSMVAAVAAAQNDSSANAHVVLLGRTGRALASSATSLQARLQIATDLKACVRRLSGAYRSPAASKLQHLICHDVM